MRRQMRKVFALVLCAALALCMAGPAGAQASPHPVGERPGTELACMPKPMRLRLSLLDIHISIRGKGENNLPGLPAMTCMLQGAFSPLLRPRNWLRSQTVTPGYLTTEDGSAVTCQEFDAKEAAVYSQAVQEILSGVQVEDGQKLSLLAEPLCAFYYGQSDDYL